MNKIIGILLAGLLALLGCSDNDGNVSTVTGADKIASFQSKHKPTFDVNEQGQVVWALISNDSTSVYLFSNNNTKLIRNTPSIIEDLWIEDSAEVSWIEYVQKEPGQNEPVRNGFVIYTYKDGKTTNVSIENVPDFMNFQMNANGTVLWAGWDADDSLQIYKYENGSIEQITSENNNLLPQINDAGDITWIELVVGGPAYINFLSRNGLIYSRIQEVEIQGDDDMPSYFVDMNENGDLVWYNRDKKSNLNQLFFFKDGSVNRITDGIKECVYPQMNDNGEIVYHAFYDNANEIGLIDFGKEARPITRANKYFSPPQINDDGLILWGRLDGDNYSFLLRDEKNDAVKTLFESSEGYFDSGLFLADDRYVCFLDGERVGDEFQYNSLYLFDLNDFNFLTDSVLEPFEDEPNALAETDNFTKLEETPTVSQDRDNVESLMPTSETMESGDSAASDESWSFAFIADTRGRDAATIGLGDPCNDPGAIWAVQAMHSVIQPQPEIVLMNGDMESWMWFDLGLRKENMKTWDAYFSRFGRNRIYPIKGNHELFYGTRVGPWRKRLMQDEYLKVIREKYSHVWNARSIDSNQDYRGLAYYFTHRNAFFVVFDSNYMAPNASAIYGKRDISDVTREQIKWFKEQVVTSSEYKNAKFRFAICHYTLYPSLKPFKGNNAQLLIQLGQHKFDAFIGACEHLYTDKFNFTLTRETYHMPVVTAGSNARISFDKQADIKYPGNFNKIITGVPGLILVNLFDNHFFINFVTPTSYERLHFSGYQELSSIKVERTAGKPIISDVGRLRPGIWTVGNPAVGVATSVPSCDCYHRSGGCYIHTPPGPGTGCHCRNKGFLGCAPDTIVPCQDFLDYYCIHPDTSKNTCLQGGGNCGGY